MKALYLLPLTVTWFLLHCGSVAGAAVVSKTITVDISGKGDFTSIQKAVNSVLDFNQQWIKIHVMKGTYNEKIMIGSLKTFIVLEGEDAQDTVIQWGDFKGHQAEIDASSRSTWDSAAVVFLSSNFVARDITFKNSFDQANLVQQSQAVAAILGGDKMAFYRCSFIGFQDTLSDLLGRHYFSDCLIQGSIDFIFGNAQSIYEGCRMVTVGRKSDTPGAITAHSRAKPDETTGFVFKSCSISGTRKTYLGRAWGPFARVLFHGTSMTDVVEPEGWQAWKAIAKPNQTCYAETKCSGPGSNISGRVKWQKNLSDKEWSTYINDSFIDAEGWRSRQP